MQVKILLAAAVISAVFAVSGKNPMCYSRSITPLFGFAEDKNILHYKAGAIFYLLICIYSTLRACLKHLVWVRLHKMPPADAMTVMLAYVNGKKVS